MGFPIRRSAARWICAPPRSFSQLVTSFFGSRCQGIRPVLFSLDLTVQFFFSLLHPVCIALHTLWSVFFPDGFVSLRHRSWFSIFGRLELSLRFISLDYSNLSFLYSVFKVPCRLLRVFFTASLPASIYNAFCFRAVLPLPFLHQAVVFFKNLASTCSPIPSPA